MTKFKALMMVALLVLASIGIIIIYKSGTGGSPSGEDECAPEVFVEDGLNFPVNDMEGANNEPCIAVNPANPDNLVAGGNDYNTPWGDSWCGAYWSDDGGKSWSQDFIPGYPGGPTSVLTGYEGAGDAVVAFDSEGNCYYAGIAFKRPTGPLRSVGRSSAIFVAKSTDGGNTWPQITIPFQGLTRASFHDKEWIAVDQQTGYIYVVWALFSLYAASQMLFSRSTDGGQSWSLPMVITDITSTEFNVQGAGICVDTESVIHIIWIDFENLQLRYTSSSDFGRTFADPRDVTGVVPIPYTLPNGQFRTPTLPALAVDNSEGPYKGQLYATWNDYRNGDADAYIVCSPDGGSSWGEPIRVNDDEEGNEKDQFFSTVCVSPDGAVQLIFYDRRDDPDNMLLKVYYALSLDGGETFYNMDITDTSFNGDHSRGPFIGDYISITSSEEIAHAIWADTRNGSESTVDSDLYSARIVITELELPEE